MLTLEKDSPEFETNANATGVMQFSCVKRGVNPQGKSVYIYKRMYTKGDQAGKVFGFEAFIPLIKKAGKYKLPTPPGEEQKWIEYTEDFEEYPGASRFGKGAFFCSNLAHAETRFQDLMGTTVEDTDTPDEPEKEISEPKHTGRGRPKVERPPLNLPKGEFSVKELAEQNKVEYYVAQTFVKEMETAGLVIRTKEERRAARGKPTQLFQLLADKVLTTSN
jgi:hypothetical protein